MKTTTQPLIIVATTVATSSSLGLTKVSKFSSHPANRTIYVMDSYAHIYMFKYALCASLRLPECTYFTAWEKTIKN